MAKGSQPAVYLAYLVSLLVLHTVEATAGSSLVLTYTITRHGARNLLPKSSLNLTDLATGVTLLPLGQRQCYQAGSAFRQRYLDPAGCVSLRAVAGEPDNTCLSPTNSSTQLYGVVTDPGVSFSNYNSLFISSALQRTVMSATSFLAGVFQPQGSLVSNALQTPVVTSAGTSTLASGLNLPTGDQVVPVYTVAGSDSDDVLIRTYNKCPAYDDALAAWYTSPAFLNMSASTALLRSYVASLMAAWPYANGLNNDTRLTNWYNVYDAFNVAYTTGYGNPMPLVNSSIYSQIVALANWLETAKMASTLAQYYLAGPLLLDIQTAMSAAVDAVATGAQYTRFKLVSSHYNVQLGILAALCLDTLLSASVAATVPWLTAMPATAAVLAFELHHAPVGNARRRRLASLCANCPASSQYAVRAVYQNGPTKNYTTLPLPCTSAQAQSLAGAYACTLDDFLALLAPAVNAAGTTAAWCSACAISTPAPCAVVAAESSTPPPPSGGAPYKRLAAGLAIGLGAPLILSVLFNAALLKRLGRSSRLSNRGIELA